MGEKINIFVNKINKGIIIKVLFVISCILFILPSFFYVLKNRTLYKFDKWFCFLLNDSNRDIQTIIYISILTLMTILFYFLVKKRDDIFKGIKEILLYILIVSSVFMFSINFTSSDVFYYLGIGRLDGKYGQNPYYTTIKEFVDNNDVDKSDTVLMQGYINDWGGTTVVYGPVWTLVCKIVGLLSFGNIDIGIFIFRIFNIAVHILNCYLIYKISKKKLFPVLYGLNPYMLIEGIMCLHNDIYVVCFILLALYFLLEKKNLFVSLIFLTIATAIKYFAILLLPLFVLYYYQEENLGKRIFRCVEYGVLFFIIAFIPYLLYIRDFDVFSGIFTQQSKFAKNFYIIIMQYIKPTKLPVLFGKVKSVPVFINQLLLYSFIGIYFIYSVFLLVKKKIEFEIEAKSLEKFLAVFLFLLITNFQPWYVMWLFPLLIWQKKENVKLIIQVSLLVEFANSVFLARSEAWTNGTPFTIMLVLGIVICLYFNKISIIERNKKV